MALKRTRGAGAARTVSPAASYSVPEHFQDRAPEVRGTYAEIFKAARRLGPVRNRWHLEIRLDAPDQVDRELVGWLKNAYDLTGSFAETGSPASEKT